MHVVSIATLEYLKIETLGDLKYKKIWNFGSNMLLDGAPQVFVGECIGGGGGKGGRSMARVMSGAPPLCCAAQRAFTIVESLLEVLSESSSSPLGGSR